MKLGFIGCGNMAKAIISGILKNNLVEPKDIIASNSRLETSQKTADELGVATTLDNCEVAQQSDYLFLAVKPYQYESVIAEIKHTIRSNQVIVTIAPGKTLAWLASLFGEDTKIVRTMPNTPALVGAGVTAFCANGNVTENERATIRELLESFGIALELPETYLDAESAVGGSAPAYVYVFIEALADGGVAEGLPREQALLVAAQTVLGSAKMVLETGKHPGALKDEVCSPGGSTIKGLEVLEKGSFRGTTIDAIRSCVSAARAL